MSNQFGVGDGIASHHRNSKLHVHIAFINPFRHTSVYAVVNHLRGLINDHTTFLAETLIKAKFDL